jgi:hypothetical protein
MQTRAVIECEIPNLNKFEVRGNVPLPVNHNLTITQRDCPFTIVAPNGTELPTQCEIVTRAPNGKPAVVQVLAIATRDDLEVGSRQEFEVIEKAQTDVWKAPNEPVLSTFFVPDMALIRVEDAEGNSYTASFYVGDGDGEIRNLAIGQVRSAVEIGRPITPEEHPTPLTHAGGMQAVLIMRTDDTDVVEMSLSWFNGIIPNPINDLYFRKVELIIPDGWNVMPEWQESWMSDDYYIENGRRVFSLIKPRGDNKRHLLLQKDNRDWRLYFYPDEKEQEAMEIAGHKSWGVVREGTRNGQRLWSWHNPATANYQAQRVIMPTLDHTANLLGLVAERKNTIYANIANGDAYEDSGGGLGELGYRNPAGVTYGGMTGGTHINEFEGVETLAAARPAGLLYHRALSRMYGDRQRGGYIFTENCQPIEMDDYLNDDGSLPWRMFNSTFQPQNYPNRHLTDDEPFDFDMADRSQVDFVQSNGLQPPYEAAMRDYDPVDDQHLIRRMKDLYALVWLDNDYVSKKHIIMHCETIRMSYSETTGGRLAEVMQQAQNRPHKGGGWGRAEAHILNAAAAGFAIADDAWRDRWSDWLATAFEIIVTMQGQNGIWLRQFTGKVTTSFDFDGQYSAMRPNEHELMMHAVYALLRSVYEGADEGKAAALKFSLIGAMIGVWVFLWKWKQDNSGPDGQGWWDTVAVGSLDPWEDMWLNHGDHPPVQYAVYQDSYHTPVVLGYGMQLFQGTPIEPAMRRVVETYMENPDLLAELQNDGLQAMTNRAHLLAILQELDG